MYGKGREGKDVKIASRLPSSVEPYMVNNLHSFITAREMFDSFRRIYDQDNPARKFQLELDQQLSSRESIY